MYSEQPDNHRLLKNITFRCYAELNDFLLPGQRQKPFLYPLKTPVTLREAMESLGIPYSEVDLVLVNSTPASPNQRLYENDLVSLYPTFEILDISGLKSEHAPALRETRFILDAHLGKLAKYLRMLGFDTWYSRPSWTCTRSSSSVPPARKCTGRVPISNAWNPSSGS